MNWLEISVETEAAAIETVSAILHEYGEGGVAVYQHVVPDDEDAAYHYDTARPTTVTTYLPATTEGARRRDAMATALGHLTVFNLAWIGPLHTREVADEDWANAWKQYYQPMRFGRRLVIKPSWRDFAARPDDLVIELDPGMAFGTGLHQTTALCLALLEEYITPGARVPDQGCGSGILSLAAARLGAGHVVAVDTSEVAVAATRDNAARNGLAAIVEALQGEAVPRQPPMAAPNDGAGHSAAHHVRCNQRQHYRQRDHRAGATICRRAHGERRANRLGHHPRPRGDVRAALTAHGFAVERRDALDEWVALVVRRQS